ncbi:hypothetical protein ACQJBY_019716 [Aegilops geniculata]
MAGELKVLGALDAAKTQWYHFTAIVIAGMGFFTDAYDLFSISLVTKLLGRIYYFDPSSLPPNVSAAVNGVAFCGTLAGQLFFGWLGDKMGRKKVYGMTLMIMVLCCVASGLSFGSTPNSVMATLCFFRFWLGFGIGGDYPLSATIMSEYANKRTRGAFVAAVFAMQGFGNLTGGIVAIIVSAAFKERFDAPAYRDDRAGSTVPQADYAWRIVLMFGAVPALLTYYWRMKMPETARYTALVAKNARLATSDMARVLNVELVSDEPEQPVPVGHGDREQFGLFSKEFAMRQPARPAPAGHDGVLVRPRHRLLLAEPVPEGHLHGGGVAAQGGHHERAAGDVQDLARADAGRAVRHHPGVLVHGLPHRRRRPLRHPARRLLLHDGVHAGPRRAVPPLDDTREPRRIRRHVLAHLLLRQLRAQLHHLHRAGRDLPGTAAVDVPRHLGGRREGGRHRGVVRVPVCCPEH